MDVLSQTINVHDLLSSPDLLESPSTPLSAPDLRLLISRLESHSLSVKSKVHSFLLSRHVDFSSLFSVSSDVVLRSQDLSSQLLNLLRLISDPPLEADVGRVIGSIVERKKEVYEKRELLDLVGVLLELYMKLGDVKENVGNGRVLEAAEGLRELKYALGVHDKYHHGSNGGDDIVNEAVGKGEPVVYGLLRKHWLEYFDKIQELLLRFMENAVKFSDEHNAVHVKYRLHVNGVEDLQLHTVLKAMDTACMLESGIAKIADLIIKHVVSPVVSGRLTPFVKEIDEDLELVSEAVLKLVPSADPESNTVDGEAMYSHVVQIVKFINKSLCFNNSSWMRCFGRLTWPRMSELIISYFLAKVVPDDASKLAKFHDIRMLTADFETALKELMFIDLSDMKDQKLSKYADNIEVHFASRKKIEMLAKARNLLLNANFSIPQDYIAGANASNTEGSAKDFSHHEVLLFSPEKCVVSEAAKQLMRLVHQTLEDICLLPPRVGLEFYHAARDALVLYEAVVPVKLDRQLDSINQVAVLIHNDCIYLSQEVLGLAFEYRPHFPSPVKENAVFVDLAPRFQLMAEEMLQRQIQLIIYNLKQAVDGADGFQNTHQMKQFESAKFSIEQVAFIIEKVRIIWEPLLLRSTYEKSMSMVLEAVFSRISKEILLLDDLAAEETLQLQRLIHLLFENLASLLDNLLPIDWEQKLPEVQKENIHTFMPSLKKLRKLAELLDMPMKSIIAAWESGELVDCNFSSTELEDFIRAVFSDSPLRRESLTRIENLLDR